MTVFNSTVVVLSSFLSKPINNCYVSNWQTLAIIELKLHFLPFEVLKPDLIAILKQKFGQISEMVKVLYCLNYGIQASSRGNLQG